MTDSKTSETEKLDLASLDVAAEKRAELLRLFPEARTEGGKIDFAGLERALGETVDPGKERYGLNWPGKAACFKTIQAPSYATLRPAPDESINFDATENLIIEGDNLEVLKLLQKSYLGRVKLIYIDPPYNTGNDFIYPDNYTESLQTYLEYTGQVDSGGTKFGTNTEADGRYHSKWLNMMYPRLYLARNLLRDDGVIAISIGQDEFANLRLICDEVFGEENLITVCSRVMKTGGQKGVHFSPCVDYIILMARDIESLSAFREQISQNVVDKVYTKIETNGPKKGEKYRSMGLYQAMLDKRANQRFYIECPDGQLVLPPGESFPELAKEGAQVSPNDGDGVWRWTYKRFAEERKDGNVEFIRSDRTALVTPEGTPAHWNVYYKIWLSDRLEDGQLPGNILEKFESRHASAELKVLDVPFDFAKPSALIKFLMSVTGVGENEITLDFFAGSGSTGHAAMELASETGKPRPYVLIQLPELTVEGSEESKAGYKTISDITKERLRRVGKTLETTLSGKSTDLGFRVFKLSGSNFKAWNANAPEDAKQLEEQLSLHVEHLVKERDEADILFEILLKDGYSPTSSIERRAIHEMPIYLVAGGALAICLGRNLTLDLLRAIADLKPERVVCLDDGFAGNDQLKTNAVQAFKAKNIVFRTI